MYVDSYDKLTVHFIKINSFNFVLVRIFKKYINQAKNNCETRNPGCIKVPFEVIPPKKLWMSNLDQISWSFHNRVIVNRRNKMVSVQQKGKWHAFLENLSKNSRRQSGKQMNRVTLSHTLKSHDASYEFNASGTPAEFLEMYEQSF